MSTIYKFQDSEAVISSTSATAMTAADTMPIYSAALGRTQQATAGSVSCMATVTAATSATTATLIPNYGYTSLGSSSGPVTAWVLGAPIVGTSKTIRNTSTSTANTVASGSTGITFNSTGTNQLLFNGVLAYVDLIGVSATAWHITAISSNWTTLSTFP